MNKRDRKEKWLSRSVPEKDVNSFWWTDVLISHFVRLRFLYEVNKQGGEHRICRHQQFEHEPAEKKDICERDIVTRWIYYGRSTKLNQHFLYERWWFLKIVCPVLNEKIKILSFCCLLWKHLIIIKHLSEIPLQRACCCIQKVANDAKIVPKTSCGPETCFESWLWSVN